MWVAVKVALSWPDDSPVDEEWWRLLDGGGQVVVCTATETGGRVDLVVRHGDRVKRWTIQGPLWRAWSFSEQLRSAHLQVGWVAPGSDS
jgi:hypothetical protein